MDQQRPSPIAAPWIWSNFNGISSSAGRTCSSATEHPVLIGPPRRTTIYQAACDAPAAQHPADTYTNDPNWVCFTDTNHTTQDRDWSWGGLFLNNKGVFQQGINEAMLTFLRMRV